MHKSKYFDHKHCMPPNLNILFLNNLVKHSPILIIFGIQNPEETLIFNFKGLRIYPPHIKMSPLYRVKYLSHACDRRRIASVKSVWFLATYFCYVETLKMQKYNIAVIVKGVVFRVDIGFTLFSPPVTRIVEQAVLKFKLSLEYNGMRAHKKMASARHVFGCNRCVHKVI